jgi:hypothetical protein
MIVILGAGISGLMLANRLHSSGRRFAILDKAGPMKSGNDQGFFYSHAPNPFTIDPPYQIISDACPGGSVQNYAMKVYGDPKANLDSSSFARFGVAGKIETGKGWNYSTSKLANPINVVLSEVDCVDLDTQCVYDTQGRCWKYSSLLSTIPLPVLTKISLHNNSAISKHIRSPRFCHKPIYIIREEAPESRYNWKIGDELQVDYCSEGCHQYYRRTVKRLGHKVVITSEYADVPTHRDSIKLFPGKIWLHDDRDKEDLSKLTDFLMEYNVTLAGRYGQWRPKGLTSHVWEESEGLGERLP